MHAGPWYAVITDVRDREESHSRTYVTQKNIELITDVKAAMDFSHPDRATLFTGYSTTMQIGQPRKTLKKRYPRD